MREPAQPRWLRDAEGKWFYGTYAPRKLTGVYCAECGTDQIHLELIGGFYVCRVCDRPVAVRREWDGPLVPVPLEPPNGGRMV